MIYIFYFLQISLIYRSRFIVSIVFLKLNEIIFDEFSKIIGYFFASENCKHTF